MADDRHLGAGRPRDLEWAEQAVMVTLDQLGPQRVVRLDSLDSLNRLTVGAMYTRIQPVLHFGMRSFGDLDPARASSGA